MSPPNRRPTVTNHVGGPGVSAQRVTMPNDQRPTILDTGGEGVSAQRLTSPTDLRAPFPWYGGKRRWADRIIARFGPVDVYSEPFAGSLAVLLASAPHKREVVCDTDGGICNFWRALAADPDQVAHWADWPTIHDDLTARHRYLVRWVVDHEDDLRNDPEHYDAKVAGWWVWGISIWIGGGWCQPNYRNQAAPDRIPKIAPNGTGAGISNKRPSIPTKSQGGKGVSVQRLKMPHDGRPATPGGGHPTGAGVSAQRTTMPSGDGQRPHIGSRIGGQGKSAQRPTGDGQIPKMAGSALGNNATFTGERLRPWLQELAARLKGVIVLNRSWESAVTPSVLAQTDSGSHPPVGILLDPPYDTEGRDANVYGSDADGSSDAVAAAAWTWAQANGDRYRIAYCCHEGDITRIPDGWMSETQSFSGIRTTKRREDRQDQILFSPACLPDEQSRLF